MRIFGWGEFLFIVGAEDGGPLGRLADGHAEEGAVGAAVTDE